MIQREATTYNQIKRMKSCYELAKYFDLSDESLTEIYDFLSENCNNRIVATKVMIGFYTDKACTKEESAQPKMDNFDRIALSNTQFTVISTFYGSGDSFDSGSSCNNNNNNNNNNNS